MLKNLLNSIKCRVCGIHRNIWYLSGLCLILFAIIFFTSQKTPFGRKLIIVTEELRPNNFTHNGKVTGLGTEILRVV
jgi:hypothetical protein